MMNSIDELAYALNMDPLELRLLNYAETDPEYNRPHSSKFLREAMQTGANAIGWKNRNAQPGITKEGEWLVGYGMGTGVFIAWRGGAKVGARLTSDGYLILQSGVTDMGPGTATSMTKLASDTFGIPANKIRFELGDTKLPPGIMQGGSGTTSSLGTTVNNASISMKKKIAELLRENSMFHTEKVHEVKAEDLLFENGYVMLATDKTRKVSYAEVIKNAGLQQLEFVEESKDSNENKYSSYSYSAHFVKVLVHPLTGRVKVDKVVSAIDAGKIVNDKTARSQIIGGVVGGIGMTFMEEAVIDNRYGKIINNNFADYHVPVHADVPKVEVHFVNKPDPILNPMGSKGMGEVSLIGFAAAAANAVFHATGKRVRDLPITPDKLI
jgi:xanthine dehydrogenase YagR molybdenum-binding subunit